MTDSSTSDSAELWQALPHEARTHLDAMLRGELEGGDVEILFVRVPEQLRGPLLLSLQDLKMPPDLRRKCIRHFWKVDNRIILEAPGFSLERAREMFRMARFTMSPDIPSPVRVWRGTTGRTLQQAREGLCWTLDRDVACWFATLYDDREPGDPIVVTTVIKREQILFFDDDDGLHEGEVVLDLLDEAEIDPASEANWHECAHRFIEKRKEPMRTPS